MLDIDLLAPEKPRRIARAEYDQMVAMGLFDDEHIELLHGILVSMSPNDPAHASPIQKLTTILVPALIGRAIVRVQLPLLAADESEPEPDVAIVPLGDYDRQHPDTALLVIEVARSSLRKDRLVKGPLYAASNFREYWLLDVTGSAVEVHVGPSTDGWQSITRYGRDAILRPGAFPDLAVAVSDFLG